jgi:putative protease
LLERRSLQPLEPSRGDALDERAGCGFCGRVAARSGRDRLAACQSRSGEQPFAPMLSQPFRRRPEVLAPAGDAAAMDAAVRAGADAVYFGLRELNARARATNFELSELYDVVQRLHEQEVKAYVALNTLVFDHEASLLERTVRGCEAAGVDAVILQDLGAVERVRQLAPGLAVHASTQMTCSDAAAVNLAGDMGARRVVLARELSLVEIEAIGQATAVELEVFVHGALCVAYSGQCLTSEAIGGRSANRGACAQACRLPYELYVDGVRRELGERAYLLSPEDLEASALVPELARAGVVSLKIEGRLKGPDYVGAVTLLYRRAVDALESGLAPDEELRARALQTFTRGSGPGFLRGVDHQRLVDGRSSDHHGLSLARLEGALSRRGRRWLDLALEREIARGDGLLVEGGLAGEDELGGRVWAIERDAVDVECARANERVRVWLGPDVRVGELRVGRRVFKTSAPRVEAAIRRELASSAHRVGLRVEVLARVGEPLVLKFESARGRRAEAVGPAPLERARGEATSRAVLAEKLSRLENTAYRIDELEVTLDPDVFVPLSQLNRLRRAGVELLARGVETSPPAAAPLLTLERRSETLARREPPPAGFFALCRNLEQARAALSAGATGVYLDFLELTGTGAAFRALRGEFPKHTLGLAPPRIRKPGEEKIDRFLGALGADLFLVRGLGALAETQADTATLRVGDFSLNVASRASAHSVLGRGLAAFTPAFDLDGAQLCELLTGELAAFGEVIVHSPLPLFHMEHCVYAALLSKGADHLTCGRPCEHHAIELRDRSGRAHPVLADVGCRNTVFHGEAQSALDLVPALRRSGVRRFRLEFVRETATEVEATVRAYRACLAGETTVRDTWRLLRAKKGYGVVRGSLRVVS